MPAESEEIPLQIIPGPVANARVALVILAALAIAAALGYLLTGGGAQFFSAHTTLTTLAPDASGIVRGSEVRLSGIPVGKVSQVAISGYADAARMVRIEMKVESKFLKNIPSDSQAIVTEDNLLGDQFVSIDEGKSMAPISENAMLASAPVKQAADRADLIKALRHELQQADDTFTQMSTRSTPIGAFVLESKDYDEVLLRIGAFNKAMRAAVGPESQLGPALFTSTLYDDVRKDVADVDKTLASIQKGEGAAGRLFVSDKDYNDVLAQLRKLHQSLSDINAGKTGLLHDEAEYRKIRDMLAKTDDTIAAFLAGKGRGGQLMSDRALYDSINASLVKVRAAMVEFRTHTQEHMRIQVRKKTHAK